MKTSNMLCAIVNTYTHSALIQSLTLLLCNNTQIHCLGSHILMITCSMLLVQTQSLSPLIYTERCACEHMCTHLHTHMHKYSSKYVLRDSLHLCQLSILPAFTSSVSYTPRSMQTSFESIYPSVLSLSLSPFSFALPLSSVPPFPFPLVVTYLVKIPVSCFQTVHIVLSLTFSALGRFRET